MSHKFNGIWGTIAVLLLIEVCFRSKEDPGISIILPLTQGSVRIFFSTGLYTHHPTLQLRDMDHLSTKYNKNNFPTRVLAETR